MCQVKKALNSEISLCVNLVLSFKILKKMTSYNKLTKQCQHNEH